MVRTLSTVRISSGGSSKKSKGGGGKSTTPSKSSSGGYKSRGPIRIPRITVNVGTPSWQKPITNFFNTEASRDATSSSVCNDEDKASHTTTNEVNEEINDEEVMTDCTTNHVPE